MVSFRRKLSFDLFSEFGWNCRAGRVCALLSVLVLHRVAAEDRLPPQAISAWGGNLNTNLVVPAKARWSNFASSSYTRPWEQPDLKSKPEDGRPEDGIDYLRRKPYRRKTLINRKSVSTIYGKAVSTLKLNPKLIESCSTGDTSRTRCGPLKEET